MVTVTVTVTVMVTVTVTVTVMVTVTVTVTVMVVVTVVVTVVEVKYVPALGLVKVHAVLCEEQVLLRARGGAHGRA